MGWIYYKASHYKPDRSVDRKAEIESQFNTKKYKVLKSCMVGATYYAAIKAIAGDHGVLSEDKQYVFAAIILTTTAKDYYDFGYKEMDESMGPDQAKCPISILKLLTPLTKERDPNGWAEEWRKNCYDFHEAKRKKAILEKLPYGTKISFHLPFNSRNGETTGSPVIYTKFKYRGRTKWIDCTGHYFIKIIDIPTSFTIIE